jgi:peptidoglycan/xylan/chitin deacetylase (PgdA/CDA1 family)
MITSDDGNEDFFLNAFPLMQAHGFRGVAYIVGNRLNSKGFTSVAELQLLLGEGWKIGSHTMTHADLVSLDPADLANGLLDLRRLLESTLNTSVESLAYPFGRTVPAIADRAGKCGYKDAMGLGSLNLQAPSAIFYLSRREVLGRTGLGDFMGLLKMQTREVADGQRVADRERMHWPIREDRQLQPGG